MVAGREDRAALLREDRRQRHAGADALRQRHHVGLEAEALVGEEGAGAAHARLHLVGDQEDVLLVAPGADGGEVGGVGDVDAALALDRLDHDRAGVAASSPPAAPRCR